MKEMKNPSKYSRPLVDPKLCAKCVYHENSNIYGFCCGYLTKTGHTRTSLHPEGLTSDCKEFKAKTRARK